VALALIGILGLGVGVAGLRTIARRSVSLRMLRAIELGNDPRGILEADLAGRVEDLERHRLAEMRGGRLEATRLGHRIAAVARLLRPFTGVRS
jgi:hypothetical protein